MKLYNLSHGRGHACYVMRGAGATIMFDCTIDPSTLSLFLPLQIIPIGSLQNLPNYTIKNEFGTDKTFQQIKELNENILINSQPEILTPALELLDISSIDAVLISNLYSMTALPFLTESTDFRGVIYMTEPTLQFGRVIMEELVEYCHSVKLPNEELSWKDNEGLNQIIGNLKSLPNIRKWQICYNSDQLKNCLSQVEILAYNETKELAGGWTVQAISSGYAIGSCNWNVLSNHLKISYINSSSSLTTHPKSFDQNSLKNGDVCIFDGLTKAPRVNPDAMITEFCFNIAAILLGGGNVIVPCLSVGIIYDLLECLSGHLETSNLSQVPLYFISPLAKSSLAYSNIYAEWLSNTKQSKVFLPDSPFLHADLLATNRVRVHKSIHDGFCKDAHQPCVVFTGHPSLRFGDIVHLLKIWKDNPANLIMFTDPEYSYIESLVPFQPVHMKVCYCPIDTSLTYSQTNKLLHELNQKYLFIPDHINVSTEHGIDLDLSPIVMKQPDILTLKIPQKFQPIDISRELVIKLSLNEMGDNVRVCSVTGTLTAKDFKYHLKPIKEMIPKKKFVRVSSAPRCFGNVDVIEFVQHLKEMNYVVKVNEIGKNFTVELPNENAQIQIGVNNTQVITKDNEVVRNNIKDCLLRSVKKIAP